MKVWLMLSCVSAGFLIGGCGDASIETVQVVSADPPNSWTADGRTWSLQASMSEADKELLMKFFQLNSEFQGSSDFEGSPKLMVSGKADRRFYWMRGRKESMAWSCIHFEGGKFRTSEGTGDPFSK
jgi:hypothetical protein